MTHKNMRMSKGIYEKILCLQKEKTIWHLLNGRVDLNGLGELLIRTKQKYLWMQLEQRLFANFLEASVTIRDVKGKQKVLQTILFPLFSFSCFQLNIVSIREAIMNHWTAPFFGRGFPNINISTSIDIWALRSIFWKRDWGFASLANFSWLGVAGKEFCKGGLSSYLQLFCKFIHEYLNNNCTSLQNREE